MTGEASKAIQAIAMCAFLSVLAWGVTSCLRDGPPHMRAEIECIKARGNWSKGSCSFERLAAP